MSGAQQVRWLQLGSSLKLSLYKTPALGKNEWEQPTVRPLHSFLLVHACAHEEGMFCSLWGGILFNSDAFRSHMAFSGNLLFLVHRNVTEQERNKTSCCVF